MNYVIITLMFILLTSGSTYSQLNDNWLWMNPLPQGNPLSDLNFVNDNTGFSVGSCGTILKTTSGGISWFFLNANIRDHLSSVFFIDANTGFAGGSDLLLIKTADGGSNWTELQLPIQDSLYDVMDIYFVNQNTGYIAGFFVTQSKIWKTTNGGSSWNTQSTGGANYLYDLFFFDENTGFGAGGSAVSEIIKTTNGGSTWQFVEHNNYSGMRSIDFVNSLTGYASGNDGDILKTTNAGNNWFQVGAPVSWDVTSIRFINSNTGYGFGSNFYLKTVNGGTSWNILLTVSGSTRIYRDLEITSSGTMHAVGTYGAIIRSTNGGVNFLRQPVFTESNISNIKFVNTQTGYAVGYQPANILKTTDAGQSWVSQIGSYTLSLFGISFVNSETGYLSGSINIRKTINGGSNWTNVYTGSNNEVFADIFFVNANTGYSVGSYGKLLKTTNAGLNWNSSTIQIPGSFLNSVYFVNDNTGFAVGDNNSASKTTNGGSSWFLMTVPAGFSQNNTVFFVNESTGFISSTAGLFKTANAGAVWFMLNAPAAGYRSIQFRNNIGYAVAEDNNIIKSTNEGSSWVIQPQATTNPLYTLFFNTDNYIYAGGAGGTLIKTRPAELTPVIGYSGEIPDKFNLSQNYPNPFNPVTRIRFDIVKQMNVKICVYDISGREIEILANDELRAGKYELSFDASGYASGVYFYRIITGDFTDTKKMVLLK